ERAHANLHRVVEAGLGARVLQAVDVAALVAEAQRIDRHVRQQQVLELAMVEDALEPRRGADAHVIAGGRNDELVRLDVLVEDELAGLRALDPEVLRRLAAQEAADLRTDDVRYPVHGLVMPRHAPGIHRKLQTDLPEGRAAGRPATDG